MVKSIGATIDGELSGDGTSQWLADVGSELPLPVSLERDLSVDVAIVGGGFVMSWWPKVASLMRVCGQDDALWLADETTKAVGALGPFLASHGVDAQ